MCIVFSAGLTVRGEDKPKRLTVSDYFAMVPSGTLEANGATLLRLIRSPKCGVEDTVNGYLSCVGDGAQPAFQVALFRFKDGRPLLAVCQGEGDEGGPDSVKLDFFQLDSKGRMMKAPRSLFPVKENAFPINRRTAHFYVLPRKGRTVLVRDVSGGKVRQKFTWNGERFIAEK